MLQQHLRVTGREKGDQKTDWIAYILLVGLLTAWFLTNPTARASFDLLLHDPDNYQRLVQVRDLLHGQSWWDTTQYRIDPPEGLRLHWSRLADVPLGAMIALLSVFFDWQMAERLGVVSLPPLLLLMTAILLGRAAKNVGGPAAESWARLLLVSVPYVLVQFVPGRIDHHGLQLVALAAALAAATGQPSRRSGAIVALWTSISLHIGFEILPLFLGIAGWLVLIWLVNGKAHRMHLEGYFRGIVIFMLALYVLTVAPSDWGRPTYDQVGRGHVSMILSGGLAFLIVVQKLSSSFRHRLLGLTGGIIATAMPLIFFSEAVSLPYSAIDPFLERLWISKISETTSAVAIAHENPWLLVNYYLFPILAIVTGGTLYLTKRSDPKLLLLIVVAIIGLALSLWQLRSMMSAVLPALLLASVVGAYLWQHRARRLGNVQLAAGILFLNGLAGPIFYNAIVDQDDKTDSSKGPEGVSSCEHQRAAAQLDQVQPGLVLNGIDSGGLILAHSSHSVLSAANHRAMQGNRLAYEILLSPSGEARTMLHRRGIDYVLFCKDHELRRLAEYAPTGFGADLLEGQVPNWLVRLPRTAGSKVLFYKIIGRQGSAKDPEATGRPSEHRN